MVSEVAEYIGKTWPTVKGKLDVMQKYGLVSLEEHPADGRGWAVRPGQRLSDVFGSILDMLIDHIMMTAERVKEHGRIRRIPKENVRKFAEEISKISRLNHERQS